MTVSATDIFEGESHTATASLVVKPGRILDNLDNRPVRVDWTVEADGDDDPEHEWTNNNPGASSDFTFTYDGLGSTTGSAVVVKAVAFDALGDSDAAETTINIWTKSETVNIVSKTSDNTYVGVTTDDVSVQTDVGFHRVDWSVDDGSGGSATAITTSGPGLTSQIAYDFSTVPHGNTVTFTATPYGVNADGEAASIEIVAWKMISIDYCSPSPFSAKVVEGEELFVYAYTNIPFSRVEYSVEHGDTYPDPSDGANDTESQFSHTFNNLRHDDDDPTFIEAHERDIVVTAYATINGEEVKSDPFIVEATVYNNNDFIWKSIKASVDSVTHVTDTQHDHILTTSHSVVYYNDDADLPQVDFLRQSGWWVGNEPGAANMLLARGHRIEDLISLELAYSATFSASLTNKRQMSWDKYHGGHAFTRFGNMDDLFREEAEVNSFSDTRYRGAETGLPPAKSRTVTNDRRKAKLLAD